MTEPLARIHEGRLQRLFNGGYIHANRWGLVTTLLALSSARDPDGMRWADEIRAVLQEHEKGNEDGIHGRPDPRA